MTSKLDALEEVLGAVNDGILDLRRIVVRKLDNLPYVTQTLVDSHIQSAVKELLHAQRQLERAIRHARQEEADGKQDS